ncbi:hypothetical protein LUX57_34350 [Actinomadura madurae]|uniref:hypothetical protein n=1 Tax=Actinomadura madurae TaxID=1993 RepID=UPI0020D220EE|nr:hypothetical protein [Actinomadura madurae]MCP9969637.1 hypothetical protein [Actinomadura madurae]
MAGGGTATRAGCAGCSLVRVTTPRVPACVSPDWSPAAEETDAGCRTVRPFAVVVGAFSVPLSTTSSCGMTTTAVVPP